MNDHYDLVLDPPAPLVRMDSVGPSSDRSVPTAWATALERIMSGDDEDHTSEPELMTRATVPMGNEDFLPTADDAQGKYWATPDVTYTFSGSMTEASSCPSSDEAPHNNTDDDGNHDEDSTAPPVLDTDPPDIVVCDPTTEEEEVVVEKEDEHQAQGEKGLEDEEVLLEIEDNDNDNEEENGEPKVQDKQTTTLWLDCTITAGDGDPLVIVPSPNLADEEEPGKEDGHDEDKAEGFLWETFDLERTQELSKEEDTVNNKDEAAPEAEEENKIEIIDVERLRARYSNHLQAVLEEVLEDNSASTTEHHQNLTTDNDEHRDDEEAQWTFETIDLDQTRESVRSESKQTASQQKGATTTSSVGQQTEVSDVSPLHQGGESMKNNKGPLKRFLACLIAIARVSSSQTLCACLPLSSPLTIDSFS